jgi:hypothetical protein
MIITKEGTLFVFHKISLLYDTVLHLTMHKPYLLLYLVRHLYRKYTNLPKILFLGNFLVFLVMNLADPKPKAGKDRIL